MVDAWYIHHWNCVQDLNELLQNNRNKIADHAMTSKVYGHITDLANAKNLQELETNIKSDVSNIQESLLLIYQMMMDMGMSKTGAQAAITCLLLEQCSSTKARISKVQLVEKLINDWHNYMVWKDFNKKDVPFEDTNQIATKCAAFLSNFRIGILQLLPTADADVLLDSITKSCVEVSNTDKMVDLIRVGQTTKSQQLSKIGDAKDKEKVQPYIKSSIKNELKLLK